MEIKTTEVELTATIRKYLDTTVYAYCDDNVYRDLKDLVSDIEQTLHHQLQKARQTWLREEIVRLEDEKFIWLTPEEMKEHDGCRYKRNGLYVGQVAGDNFNKALQTIIDRYQAELDQDKK